MDSKGGCFDNAVAESFFATLKKELINRHSWPSKAELRTEVFALHRRLLQPRTTPRVYGTRLFA